MCENQTVSPVTLYNKCVLIFERVKWCPHPQLWDAPIGDDVMDVPAVAQAQCGTAHERTHVQRQDGDEQWLPAFQVTVKQNGYKNNLRKGKQARLAE